MLQVKYGENVLAKSGKDSNKDLYCSNYLPQGKTNVTFSIVSAGGTANYQDSVKIDNVVPTIEFKGIEGATSTNLTYYGGEVYEYKENSKAKVHASDSGSGVINISMTEVDQIDLTPAVKDKYHNFILDEDEYLNQSFSATDEAGNVANTSSSFVLATKPSCPSFEAEGDIGDDDETYVSNINVSIEMDDDEDIFSGALYGNGTKWITYNNQKNGSFAALTTDARYKYSGTVKNKYGLTSGTCDSETYIKDTTPPACPTFTYNGIDRDTKTVGKGSCCYGGGAYRCYATSPETCTGGVDGSGIAVNITPSSDTYEWTWYTNNNETGLKGTTTGNKWYEYWEDGIVNYLNTSSREEYFTEYGTHVNDLGTKTKTLTGLASKFAIKTSGTTTKNYFSRIGVVEVFDRAGNHRACPTKRVLLKSSKNSDIRTTKKTTKKTTKRKTTTTRSYATSCSASKVYSSDTDCKSGSGNSISARLKVVCNGRIDYVQIKYYYPGAKYSVCHGNSSDNAVCKHYPGGSDKCNNTQKSSNKVNGAVFNLRGCGVNTVKYKYKVVAKGQTIHDYGNTWHEYNFTTSTNATKLCSPKKGSHWFK